MSDKDFVFLLEKAIEGDNQSIYEIIKMFENLIFKYSFINGKFDEDCNQYLKTQAIIIIKKYNVKKF